MRVLFFAQLKEVTGCDAFELPAEFPLDAEQFWKALIEQFPALANHQKSVRLARNWEYADGGTQFRDTDEIALIPPVSGG